MADDPTEVRDWIHFGIYVLCTVIQTVVGSIVVCCWNRRNRDQDQKEEKRKEDEEKRKEDENKQRADAEKIIAILTKNYYGAVEKFQILKEHVDVLKNKKIVTGPLATDTFTEFDVLLYMYHRDKFDVMTSPVGQAVTEIMKLFEAFALRLPTMHRACPDNIRSEFSTEIKKMGEIVYSFETRARQEPIERVFEYLDFTDSDQKDQSDSGQEVQSGCHRCKQCCCFPYRRVRIILGNCGTENAHTVSDTTTPTTDNSADNVEELPHANQQANEGLIPYRGHDVIQRAIPYIEHFRYENGEMSCNIECKDSHIKYLETCVKEGVSGVIEKGNEIRNHIIELWPQQPSESDQLLQQSSESDQSPQQPSESEQLPQQSSESEQLPDLLHLVRMVMFKLLDDDRSGLFGEEQLKTFSEQVKAIVNSRMKHDKKVVSEDCVRALGGIVICAQNLCRRGYEPIREDTVARDFLNNQWQQLKEFGTEMANKHEINVDTLFQEEGGPGMIPGASASGTYPR